MHSTRRPLCRAALTFHHCPKKLRVVQYAAPALLHFQNPCVCAPPFVANNHLCAAVFKFEPRGARLEAGAHCDAQHNNVSAQAQLQRRLADIQPAVWHCPSITAAPHDDFQQAAAVGAPQTTVARDPERR